MKEELSSSKGKRLQPSPSSPPRYSLKPSFPQKLHLLLSSPTFETPKPPTPLPRALTIEEEEEISLESEQRIAAELQAFADAEPEADPEGDEWDDLDAEDADDPVMVSEYVADIFKYLKALEVKKYLTRILSNMCLLVLL